MFLLFFFFLFSLSFKEREPSELKLGIPIAMATEKWIDFTHQYNPCFLQKFTLYETRSNFYICGRYKKTNLWRVLKIYRLEPSELNIVEDSATYSDFEYLDLLRRVHDGNRSTGGLKLVTKCFGIVGFIKFLEPYYMLLVTGRKKIGVICGHAVYSIKKSEIIPIPHSSVLSNLAYSKNEKRSFVNSACKCNMYLVRMKRHVNLASSVVHYSLYLDENLCHCLIVLLLSIKLCWTNCLCFGILK